MVSLPSIRDMFPQFMSQKPTSSSTSTRQIPSIAPIPDAMRQDNNSNRPHLTEPKPLFITKPIHPLQAYPSTPSWPSNPQSRTSSDGSPVTVRMTTTNSINTPAQRLFGTPYSTPIEHSPGAVASATAVIPTYSFGVFKSTADGSSLDHIASTTTLRRGRSTAGRQSFSADGIAPDFTVAPSSSVPRSSARQRLGGHRRQDGILVEDASQPMLSATYSSFMLSNPPRPHQSTIAISDQDGRFNEDQSKPGEKGKVHECPHCSKRFNRPSSLQIHANTHTGARPFRCPHPNCGREFNVNSNMRRHYRNHARTNFSRGQSANSKSVRRRMEQISASTLALVDVGSRDAMTAHEYTGVLSLPPARLQNKENDSEGDDSDDRMRSESSESDWERDLDDSEDAHDRSHQGEDIPERDFFSPGPINDESFRQLGPTVSPKLCRRPQHVKDSQNVTQTTYPHSYTPSSAVYLHSCTDLNVSTVLRPAFNSRTPKEGLVW